VKPNYALQPKVQITVIVCTHNPRQEYLRRVLNALQAQTLPKEDWELLLIDNCSRETLSEKWDITWHPLARHIREDELGLVSARLRGVQESNSGLLVFVDDDNVLAEDYLKHILQLKAEKPWVGIWTAGKIEAEYEEQPAGWLHPFLKYLALLSNPREVWSNDYDSGLLPIGAGMSVQKSVALHYAEQIKADRFYRCLDRVGNNLFAAGDTNLGLCCCEIGLACGQTPTLRVTHLIPRCRVKLHYLVRLARDVTRSFQILYLGSGLAKLNHTQAAWRVVQVLLFSPWNMFRLGPGTTLLRLVVAWADWMALADYDRIRKRTGVARLIPALAENCPKPQILDKKAGT
jgi:glycosyltransferase involved in cell wall biosynthesis